MLQPFMSGKIHIHSCYWYSVWDALPISCQPEWRSSWQGYSNTSVWECIALKGELKLKSSSSVSSVFAFLCLFGKCCNYQKEKIWLNFFFTGVYIFKAAPPWCTLWAWILGSRPNFQTKMDVGISQLKYPQLVPGAWHQKLTKKLSCC